MHSTKRLWTPEARARKHLKLGPNTILAIMRHGCSILTATISRSFIKAKLIFIVLMLNGRLSPSTHTSLHRSKDMPLARIDLIKGKPSDYRRTIGDVVYKAMVEILKAPET